MKLIQKTFMVFLALTYIGCATTPEQDPEVLYSNNKFSLYPDKVEQGDYLAKAISSEKISSRYQSPARTRYSNRISFKFAINEKDIEMPSGTDHHVLIRPGEKESPLYVFGEPGPEAPAAQGGTLPPNYPYTFRVDMRPVLQQFLEKGYYEAFDGSRIAREEFRGLYMAGGADPLTWDFSQLEENALELRDEDGDGIYEISLLLNPYDRGEAAEKTWELSRNISGKPTYTSGQPLVDALFKMSTEEALMNIEPDSTLRTGEEWSGVWTRDISYSIYLAFAYHEPEVAMNSLLKKVKRGRIVQDTGSGGAWPISSDRTVWALAAWEIYLVTGDRKWLEQSFPIIKNTLEDDYKTLRSESGLFKGESSFLDWREQTYPKWMSNADIAESLNLGTNVVHYQAYKVLEQMAAVLGEDGQVYAQRGREIKEAINRQLWQEDRGYYGQYLYGKQYMKLSKRFEALGESLAILFDVADKTRTQRIIAESPVTPFGTTNIYPQIPGISPYHNNGIWPFVQAYWNLAAAKAQNEEALLHGLAAIYRPGALFLTNYENFVAENGDYQDTEINSRRMLWSMAGNLAMVHRVFMGMQFSEAGITFNPVIPKAYAGEKRLQNFPYRNAVLDIRVSGVGSEARQVLLDGTPLEKNLLPADISGEHRIEILMADNDFSGKGINFVENRFSLPTPQVSPDNGKLVWNAIEDAVKYRVYENEEVVRETNLTEYAVAPGVFAEYKVSAIGPHGYESFTSEPLWFYDQARAQQLELETFAPKASQPYVNFSGKGFVEISLDKHLELEIPVTVEKAGKYLLDFRYSNGSGPWNTDNKAAIRSLYTNGRYQGVVVLPQRGQDEWSNWGYSNSHTVELQRGENRVMLKFEAWNHNMNVEVNTAMLDYLRVIPLE